MHLQVSSVQHQEVGISVSGCPRLSRAPVVGGATLGKAGILTTGCVFVYKVRKKIPEEVKLEALAAPVRREVSVGFGFRPSVPVSLCPFPSPPLSAQIN